jgi:hypothetical protein
MAFEQDNGAIVRLLNQLGLVSGTEPVTETSWRKPVTPGAAPRR